MLTTSVGRRLGRSWQALVLAGLVIAAMAGGGAIFGQGPPRVIVEHNGTEITSSNPLVLAHNESATLNVRTSTKPSSNRPLSLIVWESGGKVRLDSSGGRLTLSGGEWQAGKQIVVTAQQVGEGGVYLLPTSHLEFSQRTVPLHVLAAGQTKPKLYTATVRSLGDVQEGKAAKFNISLTLKPRSSVDVEVTVTAQGVDAPSSDLGQRTVTIGRSGNQQISVATKRDYLLNANGTVSVSVDTVDGLAESGVQASATVTDDIAELRARVQKWIDEATSKGWQEELKLLRSAYAKLGNEDPPDGLPPMTLNQAAAREAHYWQPGTRNLPLSYRWQQIAGVLKVFGPRVTISADTTSVTEGEAATFTIHIDPLPEETTRVTVWHEQEGDVLASKPAYTTFEVGTSGPSSFTFSVDTSDDQIDEADGAVVAKLMKSRNYSLRSPSSAKVVVNDNDIQTPTMPAVTISAVSQEVNEGDQITLTLTADQAHTSMFTVDVELTQVEYYLAASQARTLSASFAAGETSMSLTVDTAHDGVAWADGSVTATVLPGTGYLPSPPIDVTVQVRDTDPRTNLEQRVIDEVEWARSYSGEYWADLYRLSLHAIRGETPPSGRGYAPIRCKRVDRSCAESFFPNRLWEDILDAMLVASGLPVISIAPNAASVTEGDPAVFTLTATPVPTSSLTVNVNVTQEGTFLVSGELGSQQVTFSANSANATLSVPISDDGKFEPNGKVLVRIESGTGYEPARIRSKAVSVLDAGKATPLPPDTSALRQQIQSRIDLTANNGDRWSNRIWRGALAAVRGVSRTGDARYVDAAFAQRLADGHGRGGRTELSDLWQEIADVLSK